MIADVLADIDDRTFAIGLGNAQQVSTAALTVLTKGTGGDVLLTGLLSASRRRHHSGQRSRICG